MPLILFDIDQTLTETGGIGMRCMGEAVRQTHGPLDHLVSPDGKTDPQILVEMLGPHAMLQPVLDRYVHLMAEAFREPDERRRLKPGVQALLAALADRDDVGLGLITGNLEVTAHLKLGSVQIDHYFPIGAYGSDAADRNHLGPIALQRAQTHYRRTFDRIWVVGDTPMDVRAAQAIPAAALGVATGRSSVADLLEAGANVAVADLSNRDEVLSILVSDRFYRTRGTV